MTQKVVIKVSIEIYKIKHQSITLFHAKGDKDTDSRVEAPGGLMQRKNRYHMDEAISKTSKKKKNQKIEFFLKMPLTNFLIRVWAVQLFHYFCEWLDFVCSCIGNMWYSLCDASFGM